MPDLDKAANGVKVAIAAVELLEHAIKAAGAALAQGKADLRKAEAELAELEDRLAKQRAAADDKLDRKFDR